MLQLAFAAWSLLMLQPELAVTDPPPEQPPTAPATISPTPAAPPTRGRDPWVFRCIFEDRTRMVILAPAPDLWIAFNPNTCAIQKIWKGKMKFRGKVWDFSQENCAAAPDAWILLQAPSTILQLPDAPLKADPQSRPAKVGTSSLPSTDWKADHVRFDPSKMWVFEGDEAALTSGAVSLTDWSDVYVTFDEKSRAGPFQFEVSDDSGQTWIAQTFASTTSGGSDTDWQWNFKRIDQTSPNCCFRVVQQKESFHKALRNLRVFGDHIPWTLVYADMWMAPKIKWGGYSINRLTGACTLQYALENRDGTRVSIHHSIDGCVREADHSASIVEKFDVAGLPDGFRLRLGLPNTEAPSERKVDGADPTPVDTQQPHLYIRHNGTVTVTTIFAPEPKR